MCTASLPLNSGTKGRGVILWPTSILVQWPTGGTGTLCLLQTFAKPEAESPSSERRSHRRRPQFLV